MIWSKTEAGRVEMQSRALVKDRAQRNLLLLIDGSKTEEMLLANVIGLKATDFKSLESLGLIALLPVSAGRSVSREREMAGIDSRFAANSRFASDSRVPGESRLPPDSRAPPDSKTLGEEGLLDYPQFTAALTKLISSELGLRGFTMTLAVEKAGSIEELRDVAERAIQLIGERKGEPAADKARRALFGS